MDSQMLSIVIAILVFAAAILVVYGIQSSRARAATPEMEDRLERFGHIAESGVAPGKQRASSVVADRIEVAVKNKGFAENVQTALARADLRMTVGEFLLIRVSSAIGGFLLGMFLGRTSLAVAIVFGIAVGSVGLYVPMAYLSYRAKKRQKAFVGQLGDTIGLMANSLRAGYSLLQTIELVSRESPPPMCDEFRRVVREVGLGISPQQALNNLLRRVPSEDLDLMVSAINIQHEIGGNLGQILDVIGETIRERVRIQGEISVLTSQQRFSGYIIIALPIMLGLGLYMMNPAYMSQMFVWPWICLPIGASILLVIGWLVMRKIIAIEV